MCCSVLQSVAGCCIVLQCVLRCLCSCNNEYTPSHVRGLQKHCSRGLQEEGSFSKETRSFRKCTQCYIVLQCGIVCYRVLCCSLLQSVAEQDKPGSLAHAAKRPLLVDLFANCLLSMWGLRVCRSVLQCVAVCCSMLQCVAVCCSVLQCVAVCGPLFQLSPDYVG